MALGVSCPQGSSAGQAAAVSLGARGTQEEGGSTAADARGPGWRPWPGAMPLEQPSKATWERVQVDPSLPEHDPAVLDEFMAAPWLLPPRTKAFPWAGVHDLDNLAAMQAQKLGPLEGRVAGPTAGDGTPAAAHVTAERAITVLMFSRRVATMAQNCIYSMVKYGGVRNYLVAVGDDDDLAACADLNLPCANVSAWLAEPMNHEPRAGEFLTHDYLIAIWGSVAVNAYLLQQGYTVMKSDTDIVYTVKPVWESYIRYMEAGRAGTDVAVLTDHGSMSAGSYVALPTPGTLAFFNKWVGFTAEGIEKGKIEQDYLGQVMAKHGRICFDTHNCRVVRREMDEGNLTGTAALLRSFFFNYHSYSNDNCHLMRAAEGVVDVMDMCDWQLLFLHPVCGGSQQKLELFMQQGMWFVDEQTCGAAANGTLGCHPLRWREEETEDHLYACPEFTLGLYHERPRRRLPGRTLQPDRALPPGQQQPAAGAGTAAAL